MKVLVSCLQARRLQNLLPDIVNAVLPWSPVSRHHFKSKAHTYLAIMLLVAIQMHTHIYVCRMFIHVHIFVCKHFLFFAPWSCLFYLQVTIIMEILLRKCGTAAVQLVTPDKYKNFVKGILEVIFLLCLTCWVSIYWTFWKGDLMVKFRIPMF